MSPATTETKHVFIPDQINEDALRILRESGRLTVDYRPGLSNGEKIEAVRGAHAMIVRSATRVTREFFDAAEKLELVVRAGVGIDNIDVEAATRRGVVVQNVPEGNVRSAAEHTIALLLAMARNVPQAYLSMKSGKWERSSFLGVEVRGKTLGIIGLGKIGRHVASMAAGLGFHVCGFDPFVAPHVAAEMKVELVGDLAELIRKVDFLTIHVPANAATKGLIGAELLRQARPGLRLVNCARGGIVDENALLAALEDGRVGAAALDVFEKEPPGESPLVMHPNVIVTPHLGASTAEAQEVVATSGAQQVVDYLLEGKLHAPVNAVVMDPDLRAETAPYFELAKRLGRLQAQLLEGNPTRVVVKFYGDRFDERLQSYLTSGVLCGFLEGRGTQPVNVINVRSLANEQGLAVEQRSEGKSRYFADLLKVMVHETNGEREVGGTIRGLKGLRVVSLDSYQFDAVLEGNILISANEDRPGMIAVLGTVLASHDANISNLSLGRDRSGGTAVAVVNTDEPISDRALEDLCSCDGILWAKAIRVE